MRNILVPKKIRFAEIFEFAFSTPTASVSEAMHVTYATQCHQQIMTLLMTSLVLHFDAEFFFLRPFHIHTETEPKPNRKIKMP